MLGRSSMTSDRSVHQTLRAWIASELLADRPDVKVEDDTELLRSGFIDSLDIIRLVSFVHERFGIALSGVDVIPSNLRSVNVIAELIERRAGQVPDPR